MQPEQVTVLGTLQIPSQPLYSLTGNFVEHEHFPQGERQLSPPLASSPQAPCVASVMPPTCWTLEVGVVVLLMMLAAVAILALLYWVLLLRHKLRVARAGNAMEYWGFFRSARYTLKEPVRLPEVFAVPTPVITSGPEVTAPPVANSKPQLDPAPPVSPAQHQLPPPYLEPSPCLPSTSSGLCPPDPSAQPSPLLKHLNARTLPPAASPVLRTTSVPTIPFPSLPRPLYPLPPAPPPPRPLSAQPHPFIYTTPPSPHLSWGASSDVDVYSRVGSMRLSRISSRSQTQVILFEHSAL